ncbi:MAG: hypothetical protein KC609_03460 [Myxococcales bacterium]|nr:hypothetical protein [Myxococcales bacterium]
MNPEMQRSQNRIESDVTVGDVITRDAGAGQAIGQDATLALEALRATLEALPVPRKEDKPRVSVQLAVSNAFTVAAAAEQDRERFADEFRRFDMAYIDTLRTRALALWAAQKELDLALSGDDREVARVVEMVKAAREELLVSARYAFYGKAEQLAQLDEIQSGTGYWDLASDLIALKKLLLQHWDSIGGDLRLSVKELERYAALATRLMELLRSRTDSQIDKLRDVRDRAYLYLFEAYFEVISYGRVLYRHDKATERYPGIFRPLKPRRKAAEGKPEVAEPIDEASTPAPPS